MNRLGCTILRPTWLRPAGHPSPAHPELVEGRLSGPSGSANYEWQAILNFRGGVYPEFDEGDGKPSHSLNSLLQS